MKKTITLLGVFWIFGCFAQSGPFITISNKISSYQLKNGIRIRGKDLFNKIRLSLASTNKLTFIDTSNVVFFLETYNTETGTIDGLIWNRNNKLSYRYNRGKFSFDDVPRFSNQMIKLVENWDVTAIKKEEQLYSNIFPVANIYATKISKIDDKNVNVDCIKFKDFFKLGRD